MEDGSLNQALQRLCLPADLAAAALRSDGGAVVDPLAPDLAGIQLGPTDAAVNHSGQHIAGESAPLVLEPGRIFQDGLDRLPLLHADDGLPVSGDELAVVLPHTDEPRREQATAKVDVAPEVAELAPDSTLLPVRHDPTQGVSGNQTADSFSDQLSLLCCLLFAHGLIAVPGLTERPPAAEVPPPALRVLPVLPPHPRRHLLDLGLGHRRLDVEHRSLVRVSQ